MLEYWIRIYIFGDIALAVLSCLAWDAVELTLEVSVICAFVARVIDPISLGTTNAVVLLRLMLVHPQSIPDAEYLPF